MNNWRIVSQIASGFVIVFIVFAIFAALINFEINSYEYGSSAPAEFIQVSALASMLVFLLFAVLSFVVAWITMRPTKEKVSEEMPSVMPEPQHETQTEEIKP
jgi:flagellar biosynthesis/type III secretory pathway M-ring protein FliF/YscJ